MKELIFLKLGGSLITDKSKPYTPRLEVMKTLALEIQEALQTHPDLLLVLGHGAGSFGHVPAKEYKTRDGLPAKLDHHSQERYWKGFTEVWYQTSKLNRYMLEHLHMAGVRAISFSPASSVLSSNGHVLSWDTTQIRMALAAGLVPLVQGDVIFDEVRGGTILSTEDLFTHLTHQLEPARLLLAGIEEGVWADFPERTKLVGRITPATFEQFSSVIRGSSADDVTGGMESKVRQMLELVQQTSITSVQIFSGEQPGQLARALAGEPVGTVISV